jgi:hypothetical protein
LNKSTCQKLTKYKTIVPKRKNGLLIPAIQLNGISQVRNLYLKKIELITDYKIGNIKQEIKKREK